ncbi:molybdopterin molybdotransferase MoeA [Cyclobacterium jeungdonense]|uniref:Molybdopterin molybdenumtransferase n=1 Tax=Cyclobacterium jeungdonense TaxID=708087 RepID=A0ABT8CD30_9BACT|nr:molybdopterin molybdotransferase MoeA [Cyclobacterium jeungdonense]MDN3690306.1 molybdopterin molybdotransferase MoeA [Cyclobacterium jeungdonense]
MISVNQARDILSSNPLSLPEEFIPFQKSLNHTLASNVYADRDAPPFHRVTMDGIAIQSEVLQVKKQFKIEGIQAAGQKQMTLKNSENCLEVMTGAVLPKNTDCVVPYEMVQINKDTAKVNEFEFKKFKNVHLQGTDAKKGDLILRKDSWIHPGILGVLASLGQEKVKVVRPPKVLICATGDELVGVDQQPLPHQIRTSNVYMLEAALKNLGIAAETAHLPDHKEELRRDIEKALKSHSILLFSGAVSKGKFDFLPEVLNDLGLDILIHGVKQKPGKPFLFGRKNENFVFGFPGNPSSTLVCFHTYFKPWLSKQLKRSASQASGILAEEVIFKKPVTYHLLVRTEIQDGKIMAYPIKNSGSGDWVHLSEADAFLSLPADVETFQKNDIFPLNYFHKGVF